VRYDGFSLFAARDPNIFAIFQIHKKLGLGQGCQPSRRPKNGRFNRKRKLNGINLQFSGLALSLAILLGFADSTKMADK
jgi:hypothetical protein